MAMKVIPKYKIKNEFMFNFEEKLRYGQRSEQQIEIEWKELTEEEKNCKWPEPRNVSPIEPPK